VLAGPVDTERRRRTLLLLRRLICPYGAGGSIRRSHHYRVIFTIEPDDVVLIVKIGHRGGKYGDSVSADLFRENAEAADVAFTKLQLGSSHVEQCVPIPERTLYSDSLVIEPQASESAEFLPATRTAGTTVSARWHHDPVTGVRVSYRGVDEQNAAVTRSQRGRCFFQKSGVGTKNRNRKRPSTSLRNRKPIGLALVRHQPCRWCPEPPAALPVRCS
jgi:hypothetical protein